MPRAHLCIVVLCGAPRQLVLVVPIHKGYEGGCGCLAEGLSSWGWGQHQLACAIVECHQPLSRGVEPLQLAICVVHFSHNCISIPASRLWCLHRLRLLLLLPACMLVVQRWLLCEGSGSSQGLLLLLGIGQGGSCEGLLLLLLLLRCECGLSVCMGVQQGCRLGPNWGREGCSDWHGGCCRSSKGSGSGQGSSKWGQGGGHGGQRGEGGHQRRLLGHSKWCRSGGWEGVLCKSGGERGGGQADGPGGCWSWRGQGGPGRGLERGLEHGSRSVCSGSGSASRVWGQVAAAAAAAAPYWRHAVLCPAAYNALHKAIVAMA
mmetsp:Transcript_6544/g.15747  ORF Transcript_6544/g.15747 Transcript_6544/m.15747 type:complete len:318 (-) Transcript_6544:8-961(-)